jgi:hypothetical protein
MEKTWKPTAAGVLSIIAGAGGIIMGIVFAVLGDIIVDIRDTTYGIEVLRLSSSGVSSIILGILGIIAIVGGIYALRRRVWGLALAGSIFAILSPVGLLGLLAIIFVILGKGEFK